MQCPLDSAEGNGAERGQLRPIDHRDPYCRPVDSLPFCGKRESRNCAVKRVSVEWIAWAVRAGSESARSTGRALGKKSRHFLDKPAGVCYGFSECNDRAGLA